MKSLFYRWGVISNMSETHSVMRQAIELVVLIILIVVTAPIVLGFLQNLTTAFAGTVLASIFSYTLTSLLYGAGIFYLVYMKLAPKGKY